MTKKLVILFLNAGRRVELIRGIRAVLDELDIETRVITTDINSLAPALYLGDRHYILPKCSDSEFLDRFLYICKDEQIDLIIPLIDPDLLIMSDNAPIIEATGARILASNNQAIRTCGNKYLTDDFLVQNGIPTPQRFSLSEAHVKGYPLFIKPSEGSASVNAFKVNSQAELSFFSNYIQDPIIQEYIQGDEITVDVFSDWNAIPIAAVPRRRLKVRSGEVSVGTIERNRTLQEMSKNLAALLGTVGPINVQAIESEQGLKIIEINPRFGGGCPLAMRGGLPIGAWVAKMALSEPIERIDYELDYGLSMLRFDESTYLHLES